MEIYRINARKVNGETFFFHVAADNIRQAKAMAEADAEHFLGTFAGATILEAKPAE